jgi:Mannosyl-glycoprotein endo-beta-N-acetylglucosaminidase
MTFRPRRRIAAAIASFVALVPALATTSTAHAAVTTRTPVMGPPLLTASDLGRWYSRHHGSIAPRLPALGNNVTALAQIFIDEGRRDGVRGDIAFVQSQLETGWLGFYGSQIPPDANNYAGIYAFDGRSALPNCLHGDSPPSRCFPSPNYGARVQIQLLRSYADPSVKNVSGRLIAAPSDRAGMAPLWEYFGGTNCPCGKLIWASAPNYGLRIIQMYDQALVESGKGGACVPYSPATTATPSGSGYWLVTQDSVVHPFGTAHFFGDMRRVRLSAPLIGAESLSNGAGYWLLGFDGGIFSFGAARFFGSTGGMRLTLPVNGMERTNDNGGYWLVAYDGGIFSFGDAKFYGSTGAMHLNKPVIGMERTLSGKGYWLVASDGGIFSYGDAKFYGSLGSLHLSVPIVAMQRTPTGHGYWLLGADGGIFSFGDAKFYGSLGGCTGLGRAARLLVTPDGKGYWIANSDGNIIPFGDARRLGFPATVGGPAIALMLSS